MVLAQNIFGILLGFVESLHFPLTVPSTLNFKPTWGGRKFSGTPMPGCWARIPVSTVQYLFVIIL